MRLNLISVAAIVVAGVTTLLPASAPAQTESEVFTRRDLLDDLAVLRTTMERTHPSIYRYTDRARMDELFEEAEQNIADDMDLLEFQRAVAPPITAIRCSHTSWNLPRPAFGAVMQGSRFFPFSVKFIGGRAYVKRNLSDDLSIDPGAEILSINAVPVGELVDELFGYMWTDGYGRSLKYRTLERMFPINYRLYIGEPESFDLELRSGGEERSVQISALPYMQMRQNAARVAEPPRENHPPLSFEEFGQQRVGLLTIRTFSSGAIAEAGLDFEAFLDETFRRVEAAGIRTLIIDLRDNEGGEDEYGSLLFSYLIATPTPYYDAHTFRGRSYADYEATDLVEHPLFQEFALELDPSGRPEDITKVFDEMVRSGWDNSPVDPRESGFDGRVFILMNGLTGSTAAEVVTLTKLHANATLIGEEAAGAENGCNGGLFATLTLPHTGMTFRLPVFRYENAVPSDTEPGHCPQPDHAVAPTIEQFFADEDVELALALLLAAED